MKRKIFLSKPKEFVGFIKTLALLAILFGILALWYFDTAWKMLFLSLMVICLVLLFIIWQIMLNQIYRISRVQDGDNFQTLFDLYASHPAKKDREGKNDSEDSSKK